MNRRRAGEYDLLIGEQIRAARLAAGLSQEALGDLIGVTFQQVQKYERGTNRISAGKLYEISDALKVPITRFYEPLKTARRMY